MAFVYFSAMKKIYLLLFVVNLCNLLIAQYQCSNALHRHQTRSAHDLRSDSIDIIHSAIDISFDFEIKEIEAKAILQFDVKIQSTKSFKIDLEGPFEILDFKINDTEVNYMHTQDSIGYRVELPSDMPSAGNTLMIAYKGSPIKEVWGGFSWDGSYAYHIGVAFQAIPHSYGRVTFPCFDNFVEKSSYAFKLTCPVGKMANAVGNLISETYGDSLNTFEYELDQSISSYLVGIHCGPYERVESSFQGVERIIPVEYYAKASDTSKMKNTFSNLVHAFDIYEKDFGPYTFDKVGYSLVPFSSGAMEHATNISYPITFAQTGQGETTMAHELAHMWWGNTVTCQNAHMMWLNEGFASFCEFVFTEYVYGQEQYFEDVKSNQIATVTNAHLIDSGYYAINNVPLNFTYGRTTYDKGALVVNNLKNFVGNDSLFYDCMAQYLLNNKWGISTGKSLKEHMENYFSADFDGFFDTWVNGVGFPDFRLDYWQDGVLQISQQLKATTTLAKGMPLEITFMDSLWNKTTRRIYLTEGCGKYDYSDLDFNPIYIGLDLDEKMADAGMSDSKIVKRIGTNSFSYLGFRYRVSDLLEGDSVMIRPVLHYAPPEPQPGITLSNTHFWKIEGVNVEASSGYFEFVLEGREASILAKDWDLDLLNEFNENELYLYYRADSRSPWQIVADAQNNLNGKYGNFRAPSMQLGEYAIGASREVESLQNNFITHSNCAILNIDQPLETGWNIYPNPTNKTLHFGKVIDVIEIFSLSGNKVFEASNVKQIDLNIAEGIYLIKGKTGSVKFREKLVIN